MNQLILNTEVQQWISANLKTDITKLILKGSPFDGITIKELVQQIEAKKKCEKKLPTWFNTPNMYYPPKLSIEQTSSEKTAQYKASLIEGETLLDLTAGFGIDDYYFASNFNQVTACEINQELSSITKYNYKEFNIKNINCKGIDGVNLLKEEQINYDWIYLDPARRNDSKGKVFLLKDCLPNVPAILNLMFNRTSNILIKTSPMLDIKQGVSELKHVKEIHIVAINNEVKELLWILEKNLSSECSLRLLEMDNEHEPQIKTINITPKGNQTFNFLTSQENNLTSNFDHPQAYIYDPNVAIKKAGAFKSIGEKYKLVKLHQHSHLYTNNKLIEFPGRVFEVKETIPYHNKQLKKTFKNKKVNIITRNFPLNPSELKKQLNSKDGGDIFLFFTTNLNNNKIVLICKKVN